MQVLSIIDSNCHNMETTETDFLGSKEPKLVDHKQEDIEMNFAEVIKIQLPFIGISLISSCPQVNCPKYQNKFSIHWGVFYYID